MKFALLAGSLRKDSFNKKLLEIISTIIKSEGLGEVVFLDIDGLPVYNADIEAAGMPAMATQLADILKSADGLIISSPEYNGSISSPLKNAIDWISRNRPIPLSELPVLLTGASPGAYGAMRGTNHAKTPLEALNSYVYPAIYALPKAHEAFSDNGELKDKEMNERLKTLVLKFAAFTKKLKHDESK